jgi:hypothetical protein
MAASNPYLRWAATESSTPPAHYSYLKKNHKATISQTTKHK